MKRKIILILLILIGLFLICIILIQMFYHPKHTANTGFTNLSVIRAMRVDYRDESKSRGDVAALDTQMHQSGINMVAIGAGRADWTYFPWPGHNDNWSDDVSTTGIDYLLEDSLRFGKWAHVSAVVDVLAPRYIQAHPETAAISWLGVPSKDIVGTMELVDGTFGQNLLEMVNEVASSYPVNSITITELVYYVDGFGEQDKAAYMAYTGVSDWPRSVDGQINIDDPSIGAWRSFEIGRFIEKAAEVTHKYGKQLFVEARVDVEDDITLNVRNDTYVATLLAHADRVIVWGNQELDHQFSQTAVNGLAQFLARYDQNRVIMMIGLWDKSYAEGTPKDAMSSISPEEFQQVLLSARQAGIANLFITPSFLMKASLWHVVEDFWAK